MIPRTYKNAVTFAQNTVRAKMAAAGRTKPTPADTAELTALIARLMHHVPASKGGVMGLDNGERAKWRSQHVTIEQVEAQAWAPGHWPSDEAEQVAA